MWLFDKLFKIGENPEYKSVPYSFFSNSGLMSSVVTKTDALDFYKSWVYACVAKRSMGLAQIDFKLYQKKGNKVVEILEHPLLDLLYRVNPQMTKFSFLQLSTVYRDLLGSSPWILEKDNESDKYPSRIYIARPEFFKVEKNKDGQIVKYVYQIGTYKKEYSVDEVIFLKNYNPKNPDVGIGILEAVRMTAENDDYMVQSNSNLLKNGGVPGGYFETDNKVDPKELKRLQKKIRAKWAGFENAFKVQILQGGMKFKPNLVPPRDLEFIEGRKLNRDEIAGVFGVPKALLTSDEVNLANAKSAEYQFNKWTLEPLATDIFEQLNEFLVPKFGDDLWLDFEPLAQEDEELVIKKNDSAWNKYKTTNEIRESEGLEPLKGGDSIYLPLMSIPTIGKKSGEEVDNILKIGGEPLNVGSVPMSKQKYYIKRISSRNFKTNRMAEKMADSAFKKLESQKKIILKLVPEKQVQKKKLSEELREAFWKGRMKEEEQLEKLWSDTFKIFFKEQKSRFLEALEKAKKGVAEEIGIDVASELTSTIEVIEPLMYETLVRGVAQASNLIDKPIVADMDFLKEWLDKVSNDIGEAINETTINAFNESLRDGVEAGESLGELSNRVEDVFDFAGKSRADMIARTETARGVTEAHRQTYEYHGFNEVEWLLSPNACSECEGKNAQTWTTKSIQGEIPVHPNCKCDFTPL